MSIRRTAEENDPQARSYPLLSRSIQRTGKPPNLLLTKPDLNSGCVNANLLGGGDDLGFDRRLAIGPSWSQGSVDDLVNDYSHPFNWLSDVPDWVPITFYSSGPGSNPAPLKMPANGPSNFASGSDTLRQAQRPRSLLDIAVPSPAASELTPALPPHLGPTFITTDSPTSSSLHQLLAETTTGDILTAPAGIPRQSKSDAKQLADERALNPFLPPGHSDIMFPSLGSVINNLLEDKSAPKFEIDAMGCTVLPVSEFNFALESDCNFHYEFWDGFLEAQYCLPITLCLHLDPSRARLYEFHALAVPFVTKIAVRLTSISVPTRFTRLSPKPPRPNREPDTNISSTHMYKTSYKGCILKPPEESESPEVITPAKGIYLSPNWERIVPENAFKQGTFSFSLEPNAEVEENKNTEVGKRGFTLRAWIPVPTSLFENKETCTFRVDARAWIDSPYSHNDTGQSPALKPRRPRQGVGKNGAKWETGDFSDRDLFRGGCSGDEPRMMEASRVMTVSHLQRRRDMS